jgi:hypothetical protein
MQLTLVSLITLFAAVAANVAEISVDSVLGKDLLTKARRVEENDNDEFDATWVSGYAVKFQGCHHIKQWNGDADDESDVKISTTRLIRFRLCPESSCSASKAAGCTNSYGDYIIDMDTFMNSYYQAKQQSIEYACAQQLANVCDCDNDDGKGDDFNEEYCEYDCYVNANMMECVDNNPYTDDEADEDFNLEDYMQCTQLDVNNNNNGDGRKLLDGRVLEEGNGNYYYVGPYCAKQGGSVYMGLFTDDTCTEFATVTFESLTGFELPYDGKSIIDEECLSCLEKDDDGNDNDQADADSVSEGCEDIYSGSGKCEAKLSSGMVAYPNNNACTYMEGIRVVRQDGIIDTGSTRSSAVATAFIVIFSMSFAAMAFYVWYLRTRLGVKQNTLL